jgi:hypothetical protein
MRNAGETALSGSRFTAPARRSPATAKTAEVTSQAARPRRHRPADRSSICCSAVISDSLPAREDAACRENIVQKKRTVGNQHTRAGKTGAVLVQLPTARRVTA